MHDCLDVSEPRHAVRGILDPYIRNATLCIEDLRTNVK